MEPAVPGSGRIGNVRRHCATNRLTQDSAKVPESRAKFTLENPVPGLPLLMPLGHSASATDPELVDEVSSSRPGTRLRRWLLGGCEWPAPSPPANNLKEKLMATIDLNSDVGESFGNWTFGDDTGIIESTSSVNVACGFHAGDPTTIRATIAAAKRAGVVIGAHPGYRDLAGFGRRFIDMDPAELANELIYQIGALQALAAAEGAMVKYVKPHGALYNTVAKDPVQARAVIDAILALDPTLPLMVLPNSEIHRLARQAGLRTVPEAFADRAYNPDGTLLSRTLPGAVLTDVAAVVAQSLRLATSQEIQAVDGSILKISAESICLHGDTPDAVAMAAAVKSALVAAGVTIQSFV